MRRNCWRLCEIRDARQAGKFEAGSVLTKDELDHVSKSVDNKHSVEIPVSTIFLPKPPIKSEF